MSCEGFICEVTNAPVSLTECLACAQLSAREACPLTYPLLAGIAAQLAPRDLGEVPRVAGWQMPLISVTELLGCPLRWQLAQERNFYVKPTEAYWAWRGTLIHEIVSRYAPPGALVEQRYYVDVAGFRLTGQPDLVYQERIVDYKTTKSLPQTLKTFTCPHCGYIIRRDQWGQKKGTRMHCKRCEHTYRVGEDIEAQVSPPEPYAEHIQQLNLYAWLLAQHGVPVNSGEIIYLDMSGALRLSVAVWSTEQTADFIQTRIAAFQMGVSAANAEATRWRCDVCPFSAECEARLQAETAQEE